MNCPDCERVAEETGGIQTRCLMHQIETDGRDEQGRVLVTNWPKPRVSNPNFLSELFADWQASQQPK
jgi:hypothetical protein